MKRTIAAGLALLMLVSGLCLSGLKARIEMMTRQKNTSESISRKEAEQQSYLLKASKEVGLQDEVERIEMEIRLEEENQRYEMENLDASIRSLQENLTKLEKDKEKRSR